MGGRDTPQSLYVTGKFRTGWPEIARGVGGFPAVLAEAKRRQMETPRGAPTNSSGKGKYGVPCFGLVSPGLLRSGELRCGEFRMGWFGRGLAR